LKIRNAYEKPAENELKNNSHGALETVTSLIDVAKDKYCHKSKLCINMGTIKINQD